jgi:hypothetical protein
VNTESTYDWKAEEWTVPVHLSVSKLVRFGHQPVSFQVGYRHYFDSPSGGPRYRRYRRPILICSRGWLIKDHNLTVYDQQTTSHWRKGGYGYEGNLCRS